MEHGSRERSGRQVPVIGMGTWRDFVTTEYRGPLVEAAISAGITLFDSSPMYGRAEVMLAAALQGRRDRVRLAGCGVEMSELCADLPQAPGGLLVVGER